MLAGCGLYFQHRHALMNQSEVRLHSGCTIHFHPSLSPRPPFRFFSESLVPRLLLATLKMFVHQHFESEIVGYCVWIISFLDEQGALMWWLTVCYRLSAEVVDAVYM